MKKKIYNSFIVALFLLSSCCLNFHQAHAEEASDIESDSIPVMPKITVMGTNTDTFTATQVIDQDLIDKLPSSNGNINELLQIVTGVQFSESNDDSRTGGEIKPPEISVSGGRTADNSYLFDGTSINSLLDPDFTDVTNYDNVPGHSQRFFLHDHLVEEVSVLRANIPAKYGSFTGGVVEVKSIDPEPEISGELSYRTTRSVWGQFHIDQDEEEDFYDSDSADNQPRFTKHETNATLHIPINDEMGVLFDYSQLQSKIPLNNFDQKTDQRRRNENYFLKFVATPTATTELRLSATYAPYQEDYNLPNTLNSDYRLIGGGYKLNTELYRQTSFGQFDFNINYQESENSREAPNEKFSWRNTASKDWGEGVISPEGSYGDMEKLERSVAANLDYTFNELTVGKTTHTFGAGTELSYLHATHDRTEDSTQYIAWLADGSSTRYPVIPCPPGDEHCFDGEQFIFSKTIRPANEASANIFNIQAYLEDQVAFDRLSLRQGVRVSYENYQKNLNIAPRLAAAYDLFNNNGTVINGGYNRYYGTNLLALELSSQQAINKIYTRCIEDPEGGSCDTDIPYDFPRYSPNYDWVEIDSSSFRTGRFSELKTPYSDELTIGIEQFFLGGQLELLYIDREYKDQIVSVTLDTVEIDDIGYKFTEWRNAGRRSHEEVSLSWERSWHKHYLSMSTTWQKTKSNSSSYTDTFSEHQDDEPDELDELVWYDLKLTSRSNIPLNDYNRPYKANLVYAVDLPYNFAFTNVTNYRSSYKIVERISSGEVPMADGSLVDVTDLDHDYYAQVKKPSDLTFDWQFSWHTPESTGNSLKITLDIMNVFSRKVKIGTEENGYKLGRQYWAGLSYKF